MRFILSSPDVDVVIPGKYEGMGEMDLAGVDVAGARRVPREGEEMHGLYAFKRSFGAEWVELAGNHERVIRPWRYLAGRMTGRLGALVGRRDRG